MTVRSRRQVTAMMVLAVLLVLSGSTSAGAHRAGADRAGATGAKSVDDAPRRVLIVSIPRLTWADVDSERPPELLRFLERAAVASMSPRTVGPKTTPGAAYLTIGSGNRADTLDPTTDGQQADVTETTPDGPAADVYARRMGRPATGDVVSLTFPEQLDRNDDLLYGTEPGALGTALHGAGKRIGVVGNADQADATGRMRQVGLAAVDHTGQVAVGNVGDDLLLSDETAPFGIRLDPTVVIEAVRQGFDRADVMVVEMSDTERAEQARLQSLPAQGDAQFDKAVKSSDRLFGSLLKEVDLEQDLVMVVGPDSPLSSEQLTVFAMAGKGVQSGWASSPTTRRAGYMTLTDIAPTVLDRYGIDRPDAMNDTPATSKATSESLDSRIDRMITDSKRAVFRDRAMGPITVGFIIVLALMLILVVWAVTRRPAWSPFLQLMALMILAVPPVIYLSGLGPYEPFVTLTYGLAVLALALAIAAAARSLAGGDVVTAPLLISSLCLGVLGVDIVTGGSLQINTVFGYSPIVAGRFAGYGNQAFSLLAISALLVATAGWEVSRRRNPDGSDTVRLIAVVVLFLVVVVLDGAPQFGSDVGGVLSSLPAFAVCALLLSGRRVRPRMIVAIGVATVAVISGFALLDLSRPADSRTHLGRFAQKLIDGDFALVLQRKAEANLSVLTSTVWTLVIPAALIFFAYLTWRPSRILRQINAAHPTFRAFGISALTLGILSWLLNDSGVSMPAMMLTVALPYTAMLALGTVQKETVG